jgi:hypothetical protein
MQVSRSIFIYGHDPTLLYTRHLMLEKAGFRISLGSNLKEVQDACSAHPVDLVILCQTVSAAEGDMVMAVANAFNPKASVLSLNAIPWSHTFRAHPNAPVSSVGLGLASAESFLVTVKDALLNQEPSANSS